MTIGKRTPGLAALLGLAMLTVCTGDASHPTTTPRLDAPVAARVKTTGTVVVATRTTGADLDPDGYTVQLDAESNRTSSQAIGVNATVKIPNVSAGARTATLSGIAPNCTVTSGNPSGFTLEAGMTDTVTFAVTCTASTGTLAVSIATTGVSLDPDGYTLTLDGDASTARAVGTGGSATFTGIAEGSHSVALGGVAANCTVSGANPQTVSITAGATTSASFAVSCAAMATTGDLAVTTTTTGENLDPDGYTLTLDGDSATARSIGASATVTFAAVATGSHTIVLSGIASNCTPSTTSQTVSIAAGATTRAGFTVTCTAPPSTATYTLVGAGDVAGCDFADDELTARVLDNVVAADPNATVFIAGDIAMESSTASEYANCFTPTWGRHKARTYVAFGNHEYLISPNPTWDYFGDRAGPRGLGYYSFNLGDYWHVIVLNDNNTNGGPARTAGSPQDVWLQNDLANNTRPCTIAIWHQPYDAADGFHSDSRKIWWDRLYAAGAEIVINAHLHTFQRMAPQTPDLVRDDARGIRQFVVGTGGSNTWMPGDLAVNTEAAGGSHGVLELTLGARTYSWRFLWASGPAFSDSGSGTCH